jgi:hypothetical protein
MPQTHHLVKTLKKALKLNGKTYADVAKALDLTEASVKRLFASENFSLERVDRVLDMIDLEFSDLVTMMHAQQQQLQHLTEAQEKELTQDVSLLLVTVCVLNNWTLPDIMEYYHLSETECIRKLARLDKLKIIELLPGNRIKLLVAPNFGWLANGPILRFFQRTIGQEYFDTNFKREDECLIVLNGMLSSQSNGEFQRKLHRLARDFDALNQEDSVLPLEKRHGVTVVMGIRGWRYGLFSELRKI